MGDFTPKTPETGKCNWLQSVFKSSCRKVAPPTMENAQHNLSQEAADKMRKDAAEGNAPINVPGINNAARDVRTRMDALNNI